MYRKLKRVIPVIAAIAILGACTNSNPSTPNDTQTAKAKNWKEGEDYTLFHRIRIADTRGFENTAEAYSILLPKDWTQKSEINWVGPGMSCAGTYRELQAKSPDGKYELKLFPDVLYGFNSNQQINEFNQQQSDNKYCFVAEPMNAEQYLRNVFAQKELDNAEIISVEPAPLVVQQMQQGNDKARTELMRYGATNLQFDQTAVHATLRWPDGSEGIATLGVTILENTVPNVYNGTSSKVYTTQVAERTLFRFPADKKAQALNEFSVIMSSIRTNSAWTDAVNKFWKDVREQKQIAHIGRIKMMDEQTRAMGEATIRKGQDRLNTMDQEMRSWEAKQNSQDRMHTNFIKSIREVENYQDASGKVELTSAYDHAWSRGDGSSYIMSNNPNFDPAAALQDQNWKQMKKVD